MTKLCTELAHDPKIKVVALILHEIVQLRSNIQLENDDLHHNYDLGTNLALVMNTKVVP